MKMLRQPNWHRAWKELKANFEIRKLAKGQKKLLAKSLTEQPQMQEDSSFPRIFRIGFVGCGRVARRHAYGYLKSGRALLVSASDPSEKNLIWAQKRFGIQRVYKDYREMFQHEKLDIVSVCAPPRFHAEAVLAAVNSSETGLQAILCEKPIGLDLNEADEMIRISKQKGVRLALGHQRRFASQHVLAKNLIAEGAIGSIRHIHADCPRDILRAGIHVSDMLLHYIGPVKSVMACLNDGKGGPAKNVRDACLSSEAGDKQSMILVEFEKGIHATLRVKDRSGLDAKLYFLGEKGELELWWDGGLRYRQQKDQDWQIPELKLNPYLEEFHLEIESIMNTLEQNIPLPITGEDGRKSLELILAILISNQEGRVVNLPLESPWLGLQEQKTTFQDKLKKAATN